MSPGVSCTNAWLTPSEQTLIRRKMNAIERRFPDTVLQVVMRELPAMYPFGLYAFWLFNAGAFAGEARRGKNNRAILLLIDPTRQESALMPGYGLEEFLGPELLDPLLALAAPVWANGLWAEGIDRVLTGLDELLQKISTPNNRGAVAGEF